MARQERWNSDLLRAFEASGRLPKDAVAALEDTAQKVGSPGWVESCLMLGAAHDDAPTRQSLNHLARVWSAQAPTPVQDLHIRRDAARHLFNAGFAADGMHLLADALGKTAGHAALELSCRGLATLIQLDLGQPGQAPAAVEAMLGLMGRLEARMPHRDRICLTADLMQCAIAMCWRTGGRDLSLGCRQPTAEVGTLAQWSDLLGRLLQLPEACASDALPRLQILQLLGQQTLGMAQETLTNEQLIALVLRYSPFGLAPEVWSLLGFSCQLARHDGGALACHRRAVALAGETGARRAAALSNAEIAALLADQGDHQGACATLRALRQDEQALWAESTLPFGRRWIRSSAMPPAAAGSTDAGGTAAQHVHRACRFIEQNLACGIGTLEVAKACGVSRRTIEQAFREVLGCTVKEHIRRLRVAQVRHRLLTTTDAVKRVALDLGYPSGDAMGREFRLLTGQTITEFRQSLPK